MHLGVIAPTTEGYFDLDIDFSQVDVSFDYEISIAVNNQSVVTDLIATKYIIDSGSPVAFDSEQKLSGHIDYEEDISKGTTKNVIRIYVKWDDSSLAAMDNHDDTLTTIGSDKFAILDVTVKFTQTPNDVPPGP